MVARDALSNRRLKRGVKGEAAKRKIGGAEPGSGEKN